MNDFQQPTQTVNPYQRNIDILKSFFRRPIILVFAIATLVASVSAVFLNILFSSYMDSIFTILGVSKNSIPYLSISVTPLSLIMPLITVVCCILIFIFSKSKKPNKTPYVPITILWVTTIVGLVIFCLAFVVILMGVFIYIAQSPIAYSSMSSITRTIESILIIGVLAVVLVVTLIYCINKIRYLGNIKNSFHSIYLNRGGAMAVGVFDIIFAVILFCSAVAYIVSAIASFSSGNMFNYLSGKMSICFSAIFLLNCIVCVLEAIIAIKYNSYIKTFTVTINSVPQQPVMKNGYMGGGAPINPTPMNNFNYGVQPTAPVQQPTYNNVQNSAPVNQPISQPINKPISDTNENPYKTEDTASQQFCPNCGAKVFVSDMFCNNCGTKLK